MARGTVKWFNPAKDTDSFSPRAAVARMFSSTFQLLSGPASAHSTRDKLIIGWKLQNNLRHARNCGNCYT